MYYFEEQEIKRLFSRLADSFPGGEIVFDTLSTSSIPFVNKTLKETGMGTVHIKWGIDSTKSISKWDPRITILEDYPLYSRIEKRDYWGEEIVRYMDQNDKYRGSCIVHLKFCS